MIIDGLTKPAHFLPVKIAMDPLKLAKFLCCEIIKLHGTPVSIVSDRDTKFTSKFWKGLQREMGTTLHFGTTFHPRTDCQSEQVIQILEDMLRSCVIDFKGDWERHLSLVEFSCNNSFQSSISMAPFKALYS